MSESVTLPALGESVTEGTVTRWLKQVGDTVAVDEPLLEVSTDKVDTEIPSPIAGIVEEILVAEDETVEVGAVLARIGDGSAAGATPAAPVAEPEALVEPVPLVEPVQLVEPVPLVEPVETTAPTPSAEPAALVEPVETTAPTPSTPAGAAAAGAGIAYVTPIVRKLANDRGIDLNSVVGTGVGGRIRKEDVMAVGSSVAAASTSAPVEISPLRGTTVPMTRLRKVVAERAVVSLQNLAQLTTVIEADVTALAAYRNQVKSDFLDASGTKLSFLPFFVLAAAEALRAFPIINSTVEGESIVYPDHENISIAVDTERGLLTPVLRDAGDLTIAQIAQSIDDLASRTRNNKLKPDELSGGTFTVTNTGSRGALFDTPIVFLPQSAILGTGLVTKKPTVISQGGSDAIAIRSTVYLSLSYDHRIIDGADAARFLGMIKDRVETADFSSQLGV